MMRRLFFTTFLLCAYASRLIAVEREAIGYGSGDDLVQAVAVAEGDAVLNAGGKASFIAEVQKDKLLTDTGFISNEVYLVSSTTIETGDSFDGTYARVKVRVSDIEDLSKKSGSVQVEGVAHAKTKDAATILALGNLIINAGKKIRAYGKFENEELVKDETTLMGDGFLRDYKIVASSNVADECYVKIAAAVTPYSSAGNNAGGELGTGKGNGKRLVEAMTRARKSIVSATGAGYKAAQVFSSGTLLRDVLEKDVAGKSGRLSVGVVSAPAGHEVMIDQAEQDNVRTIEGYGLAESDDGLYELARADAVVNTRSNYKLATRYENGHRVGDTLLLSENAYVRVLKEENCEEGLHIEASTGGSLAEVLGNDVETVVGKGRATSLEEAYATAKFDAIMRSAAKFNVKVVYENEKLSACSAVSEANLSCRDVTVTSSNHGEGGYDVTVSSAFAQLQSDDDGDTIGWGFSSDSETALIMARSDALLNRFGRLSKHSSFEFGKALEGGARVSARGYVGTLRNEENIAGGKSVLASVGTSEKAVRRDESFTVHGFGEGDNIVAAMAAARLDSVCRAGMNIDASIDYNNGNAHYGAITGESGADIRGAYNPEFRADDGKFTFAADFELANFGNGGAACRRTIGYGEGASVVAARSAARREAALNACASATREYRIDGGTAVAYESKISASCVLVEEVVEPSTIRGGVIVKSDVEFADSYQEMRGYKETVRIKGYGLTKESALQDAERNAIDKVFGRKLTVSATWQKGEEPVYNFSEVPFADGYAESSKAKNAIACCGGWCVDAEVVVRQRGKDDEHGIFWYLWRGIVWIVSGIFKLIWWIIKAIWWIICAIFRMIF